MTELEEDYLFHTLGYDSKSSWNSKRTESYLRLMTASLTEYSEDHLTGASYISADTLREQKIEWDKEQKAA